MTGAITTNSTFDGRDVSADGAKLDGIEASADVTDTANVTAAGALMDSELTSEASVKALNQGVATTDSPSFAGLTVDTNTLSVDATNNQVGIGTTTVGQFDSTNVGLTVDSGNAYSGIAMTDGATTSTLTQGYSTTYLYNQANGSMLFGTNNTERMRIDSSGRLLLNKTNNDGSLIFQAQAPSGFSVGSGFYSGTTQSTIEFHDANTTADYKVRIGSETDDMVMFAGGSERMRIDSLGRVGIGTTSPAYSLDIRGEAGLELYNASGGGDVLNLRPSLGDANKYNMSISSYDHSGGGVGPADGISINAFDGVSVATGSSTARQERLRIDASGNVGIGTVSADEVLEVSGDVKSSGGNFGIYHFGETSDVTKIVGRDGGHGSFPNTMTPLATCW
jgi:hypothetical protein